MASRLKTLIRASAVTARRADARRGCRAIETQGEPPRQQVQALQPGRRPRGRVPRDREQRRDRRTLRHRRGTCQRRDGRHRRLRNLLHPQPARAPGPQSAHRREHRDRRIQAARVQSRKDAARSGQREDLSITSVIVRERCAAKAARSNAVQPGGRDDSNDRLPEPPGPADADPKTVEPRRSALRDVCRQELQSRCRRLASRAQMRAVADLGTRGIDGINGCSHQVSCHHYAPLHPSRTAAATGPLSARIQQDVDPLDRRTPSRLRYPNLTMVAERNFQESPGGYCTCDPVLSSAPSLKPLSDGYYVVPNTNLLLRQHCPRLHASHAAAVPSALSATVTRQPSHHAPESRGRSPTQSTSRSREDRTTLSVVFAANDEQQTPIDRPLLVPHKALPLLHANHPPPVYPDSLHNQESLSLRHLLIRLRITC